MAVPHPDPAISTMYEQLAALVVGYVSGNLDGLLLGLMERSHPLVTFALYGPALVVWDNMLIFLAHIHYLLKSSV